MKKRMGKLVSLLLVASMVVGMTACGKNDAKVDNTEVSAQGDAQQKEFKIFAGISALSPDNSEKSIVKQMNDAMGVTIDWDCVSGDTLTEKKNLVLNSGTDMPDAFMGASLSDSEIITNGSNSVFVPLENYINEKTMPNLSKVIKERPELLASCTMPDGHIYTLPTISEMGFTYKDGKDYYIGAVPQFTAINQKWLDAVNMKMPTTIDELHDVLVAFKTKDPNGNGKADEIPLSFEWDHWCANMTSLFSAFGFTDYNADHRAIKDGKVYYQASTENYKNAMKYFHEWYAEGLIDIEAFSQDDSQYIAKGSGTDERLGVFSWWEIPEVTGDHADEYEYLNFLSGADGTLGVNLNEQGTTGHDRFAITSACKNPELLMKWIDQCYDPITSMQIIYGPIGTYFEAKPDENGVYKETAEAGGDMKAKEELWAPNRQLSTDFGTYYNMEDRAKQRLDDTANVWFNNVKDFEYYPSVVYSLEETDTINENLQDIKDFTSETAANWIINGGVDEGWDAYTSQLDKMGLSDVVGAWQSAYDRYEKETKK